MNTDSAKILSLIKEKQTSFNESRVLEELAFFEDHELHGMVFDIYYRCQKENKRGNKNVLNSAVLYYLNLTNVKYDENSKLHIPLRRTYARSGFPDIDMDFDHRYRHLIEEYLIEKYGQEYYAVIGTKNKLKTKAAVRRVIKVLDPENYITYDSKGNKIKDESENSFKFEQSVLHTLPELMKKADGNLVKNLKEATEEYTEFGRYMSQYPEVYETARVMENTISNFSAHAAGRILSPVKLEEIAPLHYTQDYTESYYRPGEKIATTQFSMDDLEALGLIKFDLLNLDTKAAISISLGLIKDRYGKDIDLSTIDFEDKATLQLMRSGNTDGVFQLGEPGMKQSIQMVSVDNFNDLVAVIALYRPGPKDFIPVYAKRKKGQEKPKALHPILEDLLKDTYQIIVYQEQLMQAFMKLASLPPVEGYEFVKGCAKKKEKLIKKYEEKFTKGCLKNGLDQALITKIFDSFKKYSQYAFNKAHSVSYAEESFRTAWLKCHYPTEFICARLSVETHKKDYDKVSKYEHDAIRNFGFEIVGPDINKSKSDYIILGDKKLLRPLLLKGVGDKAVEELIKHQPYKGPDMLKSIAMKVSSNVNNKVLEAMCDAKLFGSIKKSDVLSYFEKIRKDKKTLKKLPKKDLFE